MIPTIPILFTGGSYGTYLEYILDTYSSYGTNCSGSLPFDSRGSSHGYRGNHIDDWDSYKQSKNYTNFVRWHPKQDHTNANQLPKIYEILEDVSKLILIYPEKKSHVLCINNIFDKYFKSDIQLFLRERGLNINSFDNWDIQARQLKDIPLWIVREYLSMFLVPAFESELDWDIRPDLPSNVHIITVGNLLYNFSHVLEEITNEFDITFNQKAYDIHSKMLKLQKHLHKHDIIERIVNSVTHGYDYDWRNEQLTILDESIIQYELRSKGIEIKCYQLNIFPTNARDLSSLAF